MRLRGLATGFFVLVGMVPGVAHAEEHAGVAAKTRIAGAALPGFETLPDGSTRLYVELSRAVPYEMKKSPGRVIYVLKGASVHRRNNLNPLVTVHFNTPVTTARLVPHGRDLWFVVDLRAPAVPNVTSDVGTGGIFTLRIQFDKGDYVRDKPSTASGPAEPEVVAPVDEGEPGSRTPPARP